MSRHLWTLFGLFLGLIACLSLALSSTQRQVIQPEAAMEKPNLESLTLPARSFLAEVIVKEIRFAEAADFTNLHARYPRRWERYVVTFEITKVLKGRFDRSELSVLVHSPTMDLKVREKGQRGRILASGSSGPYEFFPVKG